MAIMSLRSRSRVKASMVLTRADHLFIHNYVFIMLLYISMYMYTMNAIPMNANPMNANPIKYHELWLIRLFQF